MTFVTCDISNKALLSILKENDLPRDVAITSSLPTFPLEPGSLRAVWPHDHRNREALPHMIFTEDKRVGEFLGWATTYLGSYRPFTALCRVCPFTWSDVIEQSNALEGTDGLEPVYGALIVAETLTYAPAKTRAKTLTVPMCESSFSYCAARAAACYRDVPLSVLGERWQLARSITSQPSRKLHFRDIIPIWDVVLGVKHDRIATDSTDRSIHAVYLACEDLLQFGEIHPHTLDQLSPAPLRLSKFISRMGGTREDRVLAFEELLAELVQVPDHGIRGAFLAGYLASRIEQGSLEYIDVVASHVERFPTLLLWYAVCAGLGRSGSIMEQFGGLVRRLLRDVQMPASWLERPSCDVAVDELEVLARTQSVPDVLRIGGQSLSRIELMPMVAFAINASDAMPGRQMALFGGGAGKARDDAWRIQIRRVIEELQNLVNDERTPERPVKGSGGKGKRRTWRGQ